MIRFARLTLLSLAFAAPSEARAQDSTQALIVRTFALRRLTAVDAATLVSPYITSPRGGVFEAGREVRAITVREVPQVIMRVDSVLRVYDRVPAILRLRVQLIGAEETPTRDTAIAEVDSALRGLFRFAGYRLLSQGVSTASPGESFALTLLAGTDRLLLRGEVWNVPGVDQERVAHLKLHLTRAGAPREVQETLLSTGLTVPLGQSVVLGSAVTGGKYQALVLTLRAEVVQEPR